MKRPIPGGLLIAVEGIDGAGKTTVAATLAQWCGERGLLCALSKEPTSLEWGRKLRESAATGRMTLDEELDMFHKDRDDHSRNSIQPALDEDAIMILDRYYWSTAAYQGARGAKVNEVLEFNESSFPVPDLVLLLDLPVDTGQNRIRVRGQRHAGEDPQDIPSASIEEPRSLRDCRCVKALARCLARVPAAVQARRAAEGLEERSRARDLVRHACVVRRLGHRRPHGTQRHRSRRRLRHAVVSPHHRGEQAAHAGL
jgi:dTMP kinase